jgi:ADP-ribose pyrophosphatase
MLHAMSSRTPPPLPSHPDVTIESEQRVWSGQFPLDVVRFRHRRFDGATSGLRTCELWRRGRVAALLPYDPVADLVVMIEQFRFPALAAGIEPVLVELPAGMCEDGESPEATIQREMVEEMNLQANRLERIGSFMLTAGGADEICALYAGRVTAPTADADGVVGHGGEASEHEDIRIRVWSADKAIADAMAGKMTNLITSASLFWLASQRDRLRREWR